MSDNEQQGPVDPKPADVGSASAGASPSAIPTEGGHPVPVRAPWVSPALPVGPRVPVWAPEAHELLLHLTATDEILTMERAADGWWLSPRDLPDGTDYAYRVDGSPDRPDPRSPRQPEGVHGPSRTVRTDAWEDGLWTDGDWAGLDARGAVVYELHVGTFTADGTLDAAAARLPELAALGVEIVELMPLASFPGRAGWGYDGVALWSVHEPYGGPEALARFVDAAHRAGLAVCLDVVYNHLGPSGNYLGVYGPYFTSAHDTPWGAAVNYDQPGSEQVRAFVIDNALRWLRDFHVDALRLDAIHAIQDDHAWSKAVEPHRHLLARLADAVEDLSGELGRPLSLIAESDLNDAGVITPTDAAPPALMPSLGMTAQWADDVHHAIHVRLTGEAQGYYADFAEPGAFETAYGGGFLHAGTWSSFRGSSWGAPLPAGTDPRRLVVFASDHDQVGNRATGDRPSASLSDARLAAEAALVLLSPYTPMLFQGEEWGTRSPFQFFTDHSEPELAAAVTEGRRREFASFGWDAAEVPDPQAGSTVVASTLDRDEARLPERARVLAWYEELLRVRRLAGLKEQERWARVADLGDAIVSRLVLDAPDAALAGARSGDELVLVVALGADDARTARATTVEELVRRALARDAEPGTGQGDGPVLGNLTAVASWSAGPGTVPGAVDDEDVLILLRRP